MSAPRKNETSANCDALAEAAAALANEIASIRKGCQLTAYPGVYGFLNLAKELHERDPALMKMLEDDGVWEQKRAPTVYALTNSQCRNPDFLAHMESLFRRFGEDLAELADAYENAHEQVWKEKKTESDELFRKIFGRPPEP